MGSISIATMGKFVGPPTLTASARYGGSSDVAVREPKKPIIRVKSVQHQKQEKNVIVTCIEEL